MHNLTRNFYSAQLLSYVAWLMLKKIYIKNSFFSQPVYWQFVPAKFELRIVWRCSREFQDFCFSKKKNRHLTGSFWQFHAAFRWPTNLHRLPAGVAEPFPCQIMCASDAIVSKKITAHKRLKRTLIFIGQNKTLHELSGKSLFSNNGEINDDKWFLFMKQFQLEQEVLCRLSGRWQTFCRQRHNYDVIRAGKRIIKKRQHCVYRQYLK